MQRRVDLDGPSNYRDLGGLPVGGGSSTRFGLVYRADRLCTLSDADLSRLEDAGVRHVFDLRSDAEATEFPDRLPAGASYLRLPMTSDRKFQARTIYQRIIDGEIKAYGEAEMVGGYVRMLQNFGPSLARIVRQVAQGEPTVIHCTAGKDRTGVAAMLLLDLAGVAAEHVVADYALSSERRPSLQRDQTEATSLIPLLEGLWARPGRVRAAVGSPSRGDVGHPGEPARPLGGRGRLPGRRGNGRRRPRGGPGRPAGLSPTSSSARGRSPKRRDSGQSANLSGRDHPTRVVAVSRAAS